MTNRTPASPLALTAIAAVFALSSTAALAQQTAAPDPAPVAAPATAAAPVDSRAPIVIPETRSAPVEQAAPTATTTTAVKPTRANVAVSRVAPRPVAHTVATTTAEPVVSAVQTAPRTATTIAPTISAEPSPVAVEVAQVTPVASVPNTAAPAQNDNTALELGLLGLVALGGAGAYGLARRRRHVVAPDTVYGDELLAAATPVVEPPVTSAQPITASPWVPAIAAATAVAESRAERVPTATSMAGTAIPAGPLPTGTALGALFERMANAAPDAENPFTATKRRRQRVRWLLKQHEYLLQNAGSQPFDYRNHATASQPQRELVEA